MSLDLSSVEAKLTRAKAHFDAYRSEVQKWRDKNPYRVIREQDDEFTRFQLVLKVDVEPDLAEWSLIIGDCIHNQRSALDHLVFTIAVHESGQNPPPKEDRLGFPIVDQIADFKSNSRRIATISAPVRAAIEAVQPYNRPHPAVPPPLAILRDLEKTDKHKLLRLAFAAQAKANISLSLPVDRSGRGKDWFNPGELKHNAVLWSWTFDKPEPNMEFEKFEIGIAIALWHRKLDESVKGHSEASALLALISNEIKFVVDTVAGAVTM